MLLASADFTPCLLSRQRSLLRALLPVAAGDVVFPSSRHEPLGLFGVLAAVADAELTIS